MSQPIRSAFEHWGEGVNTALEPDKLPLTASPRASNTAFVSAFGGIAVPQKRRGLKQLNATPISGTPIIRGLFEYKRLSAGVFTKYDLIVSHSGRLDKLNSDGTTTTVNATAFTSDLGSPFPFYPDFAVANNLCFIVNSVDKKKFDGTSVTNFGITRPAAAPTIADGGAGAMAASTFEVALSYYNSSTGHESSRSDISSITLGANRSILVTLPTPPDSQVDYIRVHVRDTALQSRLFRVTSGTGYNSTGGGWSSGTPNMTINLTTAQIQALSIFSPDSAENDPPPAGIRYLAWHHTRMFAASDTTLYWSKLEKPESFDPDNREPVNPSDGQQITGLRVLGGFLVIFKTSSIHVLEGDDPLTWVFNILDPDTGCVSHRSISSWEGVLRWWSEQGPVSWDGNGVPVPIGQLAIPTLINATALNFGQLIHVAGVVDPTQQRTLFVAASASYTRNDEWFPFNYRLNRWEGRWDPIDAAAFGIFEDSNGQPWVHVGGYLGTIYKLWDADNDGLPSGSTAVGTFTASGSSVTTVTDTAATFPTSGNGLKELKVTIEALDGTVRGTVRQRITSNTGTSFTLANAVTGLTSGETYRYYIAGPAWEFDTAWDILSDVFTKKRFQFLYVQMRAMTSTVAVGIATYFNFSTVASQLRFATFSPESTVKWDTALWDVSETGEQTAVQKRFRIGRSGFAWRARFFNRRPDAPLTLLRTSVEAELLSDRR